MRSFQDAIPRNHCFGCGPLNPDGLKIESRWEDAPDPVDVAPSDPGSGAARVALCRYRPAAHHMAGPTHVVNGGIIATVIDCHAICTAIADAYAREGRPVGTGDDIWYATGELRVRYLAPAPLGEELEVRARVTRVDGRKSALSCSVDVAGTACAEADVLAIRVPAAWRDAPAA